ncbi:hypothetical protein CsatA_010898 [Cannabis sativa]
MSGSYSSVLRTTSLQGLMSLEENEDLQTASSMPTITQPKTPHEPMEFLSRSWSISASEITKALAQKQKQFSIDKNPDTIRESGLPPIPGKGGKSAYTKSMESIGKWFQTKETSPSILKKKDKARIENARVHSALSIAGLAAALAAVAAEENSGFHGSKMRVALASATELLASHCIEMAEAAGADYDRVASVVRSAVDIQSPGDLVTLTAAAATALRGEAALRARLPKESRKNAAISPFEKGMTENKPQAVSCSPMEDESSLFVGDLLQVLPKGGLQWKRVTIHINENSHVIIKLRSKHVGGAFSKNIKCIVYGVCDEKSAWPYKRVRDSSEEVSFGLKTGQGLMEFKCKSKTHKQRWVDGIQSLLRKISSNEESDFSLGFSYSM